MEIIGAIEVKRLNLRIKISIFERNMYIKSLVNSQFGHLDAIYLMIASAIELSRNGDLDLGFSLGIKINVQHYSPCPKEFLMSILQEIHK